MRMNILFLGGRLWLGLIGWQDANLFKCRVVFGLLCAMLVGTSADFARADQITIYQPHPFSVGADNFIEMSIASLDPRQGLQIELEYDGELLQATSIELVGRLATAFQAFVSTDELGIIRALFLDDTAVRQSLAPGTDVVARLRFDIQPGVDHVALSRAFFNVNGAIIADGELHPVDVSWTDFEGGIVPTLVESFTAERLTPVEVRLEWSLRQENESTQARVYRVGAGSRVRVADERGSEAPSMQVLIDRLPPTFTSDEVSYELVFFDGSQESAVAFAVAEAVLHIPFVFGLEQNVPNPFNPSTEIRFMLSNSGRARLGVYDFAGRLVKALIDENLPIGPHSVVWNGQDHHGHNVPAGVYLYRLEAGGRVVSRKLLLLK